MVGVAVACFSRRSDGGGAVAIIPLHHHRRHSRSSPLSLRFEADAIVVVEGLVQSSGSVCKVAESVAMWCYCVNDPSFFGGARAYPLCSALFFARRALNCSRG